MAHELDAYWPSRVPGLQPAGHLLSFHGLYQSIYRLGSRSAHGAIDALDPYVRITPRRTIVAVPRQDAMLTYSLPAPLLGIALMIGAQQFPWIDEATARRFMDRATAEVARQRAARASSR